MPASPATDVAVVIPAYNERDRIERTLDPLTDQDADVIVVVGGDDDTDAVARAHPATDRVLADEKADGPAAARNQGARATDAEVVCFTDADTIVPDEWIRRHRRHYANSDVVGVGGPLRVHDGSRMDDVLFKVLSDWWYQVSWPVGFVQASSNNCSYRREPFLDAGGFDEALSFIEDTDCSLRMNDVGEMVYDPTAFVETSARRQQSEGYVTLFLTYAKGYARMARGRDPGGDYFQDW